jgi:AbiV family abortive infection protein
MRTHVTIPWKRCDEGATRSLTNAADLMRDSLILYKRGRYPTAFSLLVLAREEIGKALLLAESWSDKQDIEFKSKQWRSLFSHPSKLAALAAFDELPESITLERRAKGNMVQEALKESGLYTEWTEWHDRDGRWRWMWKIPMDGAEECKTFFVFMASETSRGWESALRNLEETFGKAKVGRRPPFEFSLPMKAGNRRTMKLNTVPTIA